MYIRTEKWMKKNRGMDARACIFTDPYCRYWKACIEEEKIEWFDSPKLRLLKEHEYDKK
jgi:hypothetical protein